MEEKRVIQDSELIEWIRELVEELGPFQENTLRENKWRTTEQLANSIAEKWKQEVKLDNLTRLLNKHEADAIKRLRNELSAEALIRRAMYPDRTTVLPLWGSTKYHGQPWLKQAQPYRIDKPDDMPAGRKVPESAPYVFMSHTQRDKDLANRLACSLADIKIGTWMFETDIGHKASIADCVREALKSTSGCVALVTRDSIASLWVLTELHTVLQTGRKVTLVINMQDDLLVHLLKSVHLPHPNVPFDLSVDYDGETLENLKQEYSSRNSITRVSRYKKQVHDFLASLPSYLAGRPALAYPDLPKNWQGTIELAPLSDLQKYLK